MSKVSDFDLQPDRHHGELRTKQEAETSDFTNGYIVCASTYGLTDASRVVGSEHAKQVASCSERSEHNYLLLLINPDLVIVTIHKMLAILLQHCIVPCLKYTDASESL